MTFLVPNCKSRFLEHDSLLNSPSSISVSSLLHFPKLKPVEPTIDFGLLAKQYLSDCQSFDLVFCEASMSNCLIAKAMIYPYIYKK